MKIIGIIQVKGGVGRSTVATNLAGAMATQVKTALIDCDMPQGTSASWYAIRQQQQGTTNQLSIATARDHHQLVHQITTLSAENELIVIDCPPRIAELTRATLIVSDLCLVPLGASAAEIWATSDLKTTIDEARQTKPTVDARLVWNRFRSSTSSAQELSLAVREGLGLQELTSKLGFRVAYSDAMARGLTALEWSDKAAKNETLALAKEVGKILKIRWK